ncbi:MAG: DUF2029 domain-containing protein [Gemmataceae bacterium]|nr:DUF2029 domain-containing protein [Gemmataceae bacterium]
MPNSTLERGLPWWQRAVLVLLLAVCVAFGVLTVIRAAGLQRRMGDLGVFLRAAWAVRTGADLYTITDDNNWHYNYPPLLAILLVPLADPPAGADSTGMVPYAVSAGLWYAFGLLCLALAVHWLASALEETTGLGERRGLSPPPPDRRDKLGGSLTQRWWALRVLPVLLCLPPAGHTLMRGQVNLLLLALLCAMTAALVRGRRFRAGLWLAGAICLKVIPAFLLVYPLWRRDGRCLGGCALGLVAGLVAVPVAAFGPARTLHHYQTWAAVVIGPGLGAGGDQSRAKELTDVTGTASQSFQAVIHNTLYPEPSTRPRQAGSWARAAHWGIGGLLTLFTLLTLGRRPLDGLALVLGLAALIVLMMLLSPVCHLHYFTLAIPLVMGLLADAWESRPAPRLGVGLLLVLLLLLTNSVVPQVPGLQVARDLGVAMYGVLLLWLMGSARLRARTRAEPLRKVRAEAARQAA